MELTAGSVEYGEAAAAARPTPEAPGVPAGRSTI
jgi:hypothetical protein